MYYTSRSRNVITKITPPFVKGYNLKTKSFCHAEDGEPVSLVHLRAHGSEFLTPRRLAFRFDFRVGYYYD